jgi:glycerol-3-phosphate acyltransferase PlsY
MFSFVFAFLRLYRLWFAAVAGYLIGSILTADLVSKAANRGKDANVDLRATGSGNPGAGNAFANLGKRWGVAVLVGDILKGGAGSQAGRMIAGDNGAYIAATASVIGHCFPAWTEFKGGKGVATSAGTTLVCFPAYIPFEMASVGGSFAISRHAGKATAAGCTMFVVLSWAWRRFNLRNGWGPQPTAAMPLYALATSGIIAYKFLTAPEHMGDLKDRAMESEA